MEALFSSDVKRNEIRCRRLFMVTGRLIGMFMIYGGTGGEGRWLIFCPLFTWR